MVAVVPFQRRSVARFIADMFIVYLVGDSTLRVRGTARVLSTRSILTLHCVLTRAGV